MPASNNNPLYVETTIEPAKLNTAIAKARDLDWSSVAFGGDYSAIVNFLTKAGLAASGEHISVAELEAEVAHSVKKYTNMAALAGYDTGQVLISPRGHYVITETDSRHSTKTKIVVGEVEPSFARGVKAKGYVGVTTGGGNAATGAAQINHEQMVGFVLAYQDSNTPTYTTYISLNEEVITRGRVNAGTGQATVAAGESMSLRIQGNNSTQGYENYTVTHPADSDKYKYTTVDIDGNEQTYVIFIAGPDNTLGSLLAKADVGAIFNVDVTTLSPGTLTAGDRSANAKHLVRFNAPALVKTLQELDSLKYGLSQVPDQIRKIANTHDSLGHQNGLIAGYATTAASGTSQIVALYKALENKVIDMSIDTQGRVVFQVTIQAANEYFELFTKANVSAIRNWEESTNGETFAFPTSFAIGLQSTITIGGVQYKYWRSLQTHSHSANAVIYIRFSLGFDSTVLQSDLEGLDTRITKNKSDIAGNKSSITTLQGQVTANTNSIESGGNAVEYADELPEVDGIDVGKEYNISGTTFKAHAPINQHGIQFTQTVRQVSSENTFTGFVEIGRDAQYRNAGEAVSNPYVQVGERVVPAIAHAGVVETEGTNFTFVEVALPKGAVQAKLGASLDANTVLHCRWNSGQVLAALNLGYIRGADFQFDSSTYARFRILINSASSGDSANNTERLKIKNFTEGVILSLYLGNVNVGSNPDISNAIYNFPDKVWIRQDSDLSTDNLEDIHDLEHEVDSNEAGIQSLEGAVDHLNDAVAHLSSSNASDTLLDPTANNAPSTFYLRSKDRHTIGNGDIAYEVSAYKLTTGAAANRTYLTMAGGHRSYNGRNYYGYIERHPDLPFDLGSIQHNPLSAISAFYLDEHPSSTSDVWLWSHIKSSVYKYLHGQVNLANTAIFYRTRLVSDDTGHDYEMGQLSAFQRNGVEWYRMRTHITGNDITAFKNKFTDTSDVPIYINYNPSFTESGRANYTIGWSANTTKAWTRIPSSAIVPEDQKVIGKINAIIAALKDVAKTTPSFTKAQALTNL